MTGSNFFLGTSSKGGEFDKESQIPQSLVFDYISKVTASLK